jgi:beta-carotene 15,15'-dioxygenase
MQRSYAIYGVAAGVGFLFCAAYIWQPAWVQSYGLYVLFATVLTLGLIHGSLDYEVELAQAPGLPLLPFLGRYLAQMALVAAVWILLPTAALVLFLLFTAWHFGETDLAIFRAKAPPWVIAVYGIGLTTWLLGAHLAETLAYLQDLAVFKASPELAAALVANQAAVCWGAAGLVAVACLASPLRGSWQALATISAILAFTYYLPLMLAFTLYFGFWHSLHTLAIIRADIQSSYQRLIVRAMPFLIVSILGTGALLVVLGQLELNSVLILFIFISSLTLPHAQVMHRMFGRFWAAM